MPGSAATSVPEEDGGLLDVLEEIGLLPLAVLRLVAQILAHGRWAWLIHGVLWTLFHFPQRWTYLQILPITLALSYVTYRTRNTSIAMAAHYIGNGALGMIPILLIVAGE